MTKNGVDSPDVNDRDGRDVAEDPPNDEADSGGASGIASRIAVGWAKEMGYEKVALVIEKWPELVGKGIAIPCKKIRDSVIAGKPIPPELEAEAQKALEDNPKEAALLLGPLMAESFASALDAKVERDFVLSSYAQYMSIVCQSMKERQTSFVLRGFIHSPDCVSYWERSVLGDEAFQRDVDHLRSNFGGPKVYILDLTSWAEPDESVNMTDFVTVLNEEIRKSSIRKLPGHFSDHTNNKKISSIDKIYETKVVISRLDPANIEKEEGALLETSDGFLRTRPSPKSYDLEIPSGAPGIPVMLESLYHAMKAQDQFTKDLRATLETARAVVAKKVVGKP
jgi:hypothetical protein